MIIYTVILQTYITSTKTEGENCGYEAKNVNFDFD